MHCQMKTRIVPFYRLQQITDLDLCIKLLTDFTHKSLFGTFPALNLSARELPPALPLAISSLGGEDLSILDNDCRYYLYRFHFATDKTNKDNDIYISVKERLIALVSSGIRWCFNSSSELVFFRCLLTVDTVTPNS